MSDARRVLEWGIGVRVAIPITVSQFDIKAFSPEGRNMICFVIPQVDGRSLDLQPGKDYLLTLRLEDYPTRPEEDTHG